MYVLLQVNMVRNIHLFVLYLNASYMVCTISLNITNEEHQRGLVNFVGKLSMKDRDRGKQKCD